MARERNHDAPSPLRKWGYLSAFGVAVAFIAFIGSGVWADMELERLKEAAREAGEPVTLLELDAWYPALPLPDNGAPLYERVVSQPFLWDQKWDETLPLVGHQMELPLPWVALGAETLAVIDEYLAIHRDRMELIYEASKFPGHRFSIDLTLGANTQLPHLAHLRQAARVLSLEAMLAAERGQPERATEAILAGLRTGNALRNEPILISQLVRIAIHGIVAPAMERVFSQTALTDDMLQRLATTLAASESPESEARAFIGERCFMISAFNEFNGASAQQLFNAAGAGGNNQTLKGLYKAAPFVYKATGLYQRDRLTTLECLARLIEIARLAPHEQQAATEEWNAYIENLPMTRLLTKATCRGLGRATEAFLRNLANLRTASVAVALERYRLTEGHYPETLDALPARLGDMPLDPYTGKPLLYKREGEGYCVYSVSANGVDDGGDETKVGITFNDIVFRAKRR